MSAINFPLALPSSTNHWVTLSREGPLFILHMHNKDNRFTTEFCKTLLEALQIVEDLFNAAEEPTDMALITVGNGKIFSNGLDLKHAHSYPPFMESFLLLLRRMLTFCIPTVAAINGHAFAGGCMFALTHDYRVMRTDRGYICMNEVDLPAPLAPGMSGLLKHKLTPKTFRDMVLQGHRFTAKEALEQDFVDVIAPENEVLDAAKALALKWAPKAKAGIVYKQLKDVMYSDIIRLLATPYHRLASKI